MLLIDADFNIGITYRNTVGILADLYTLCLECAEALVLFRVTALSLILVSTNTEVIGLADCKLFGVVESILCFTKLCIFSVL